LNNRRYFRRHFRRVAAQQLPDLGNLAKHNFDGPFLMMEAEHFLHHMGKRSMAHVVKQSGGSRGRAIVFIDLVLFSEPIEHATHQVKRAKRVSKARVFSSLVSVETEAKLLDAA